MKKIILLLVLILCLFGCSNKTEDNDNLLNLDLNEILSSKDKTNEDEDVIIENQDYYQLTYIQDSSLNYLKENGNKLFKDFSNSYLIYFHQDNCIGCLKINKIIDTFIRNQDNESDKFINVWFVDVETGEKIFDLYNVEETPTLLFAKNDEEPVLIVGYDNIKGFIEDID